MQSEKFNVVFVLKPADHQAGATGDSINMGLCHRIAWLVQFGTVTGDAVLTIKSGASAGTETTAETFRYRLADADQGSANADLYGAWATSSSLTLTAATYDNKVLICELDNDQITTGQPWVTLAFSNAADALNASVVAVCSARHMAHDTASVI